MKKLPTIEYTSVPNDMIEKMLTQQETLRKVKDHKEDYYASLYVDDGTIKNFTLIFISRNEKNQLEGYATNLKVKQKNRNRLVAAFSILMYEFFPKLDKLKIFNILQYVQKQSFEMMGYHVYSKQDEDEYNEIKKIDPNPMILIKASANYQGSVYVPIYTA